MRSLPVLTLALLAVLASCASNKSACSSDCLSSICIIDRNGMSETITARERLKRYEAMDFSQPQTFQKVLRMYGRDESGGIESVITSYHPNGQIQQYLESYNGRALGAYREWHANGNQRLEATVIGGVAELGSGAEGTWLFDGISYAWDQQGNLQAKIQYHKGALDGPSLHFHTNGSIWKEAPFSNGKMHGQLVVRLASGEILETVSYHQGKKHGEARRYWNPDQISALEVYQDDLLVEGSYFIRDGSSICEVKAGSGHRATFGKNHVARIEEYTHGRPGGKVQVFSDRGQLVRSYHIKNGLKHGLETEYYVPSILEWSPSDRPQEKLCLNWHEGIIQGTAKTWYEDGQIESQREMSQNTKQGVSTAWYRDGSLMLVEEYDADHLVSGTYLRQGEKKAVSKVVDGSGLAMIYDADGLFLNKIHYEDGQAVE